MNWILAAVVVAVVWQSWQLSRLTRAIKRYENRPLLAKLARRLGETRKDRRAVKRGREKLEDDMRKDRLAWQRGRDKLEAENARLKNESLAAWLAEGKERART